MSTIVIWRWFVAMRSIFFFKQKTAYEMRISDWSSDVCSSDLLRRIAAPRRPFRIERGHQLDQRALRGRDVHRAGAVEDRAVALAGIFELPSRDRVEDRVIARPVAARAALAVGARIVEGDVGIVPPDALLAEPQFRRALETHVMMDELGPFEEALQRSEEHT